MYSLVEMCWKLLFHSPEKESSSQLYYLVFFFSNKHVIISEIFIISDYIWNSAACEVICELNCSYFVFINVNLNLILIEKSF